MYYLPHHYTHTLAASSTRPTARPQDPMSDKRSALAQLPLPHSVVTEPGVPHNKRAQSRVNSGSRSTSPAQPHQFPRFAQPDDPPSRTSPPPLSNRSPLPSWQTRKPHRATDARLIGRTQRTCEGGEGRQRFFSPSTPPHQLHLNAIDSLLRIRYSRYNHRHPRIPGGRSPRRTLMDPKIQTPLTVQLPRLFATLSLPLSRYLFIILIISRFLGSLTLHHVALCTGFTSELFSAYI